MRAVLDADRSARSDTLVHPWFDSYDPEDDALLGEIPRATRVPLLFALGLAGLTLVALLVVL